MQNPDPELGESSRVARGRGKSRDQPQQPVRRSPRRHAKTDGKEEGDGTDDKLREPQGVSRLPVIGGTPTPILLPIPQRLSSLSSLAQPQSLTTSSLAQQPTPTETSSARSPSPSKKAAARLASLTSLEVPVRYTHADLEAMGKCLTDDDTLRYHKLLLEHSFCAGVIPARFRNNHPTLAKFVFTSDVDDNNKEEEEAEYIAITKHILAATTRSIKYNRHELAWNMLVHLPMLQLALAGRRNVSVEPVVSASIHDSFKPRARGGSSSSQGKQPRIGGGSSTNQEKQLVYNKMIDFVLFLDLDGSREGNPPVNPKLSTPISTSDRTPSERDQSIISLVEAIDALFIKLPLEAQTINQSMYEPLQKCPIGVSIETKKESGDANEARFQLGVWIAAWYKRIRELCGGNKWPILTVPVIMIVGSKWNLLWAIDEEGKNSGGVHIVGSLEIGDTGNVPGCYQLLRSLRILVDWMELVFAPWMLETAKQGLLVLES